jgi:hypothetical protein
MRRLYVVICPVLILLFSFSGFTAPQSSQASQYSKPGISLSFPSEWYLSDTSDALSQNLALDSGRNEAKIVVMALRRQMGRQEIARAQPEMTRAILNNLTRSITQAGGEAQQSPLSAVIGGSQASGVRLRTVLDGEPGRVDVYWLVISDRLVHVILLGSDKALERAAAAWAMVCGTLQIDEAVMPKGMGKEAAAPGRLNR